VTDLDIPTCRKEAVCDDEGKMGGEEESSRERFAQS
jgi:hypothetical protein